MLFQPPHPKLVGKDISDEMACITLGMINGLGLLMSICESAMHMSAHVNVQY